MDHLNISGSPLLGDLEYFDAVDVENMLEIVSKKYLEETKHGEEASFYTVHDFLALTSLYFLEADYVFRMKVKRVDYFIEDEKLLKAIHAYIEKYGLTNDEVVFGRIAKGRIDKPFSHTKSALQTIATRNGYACDLTQSGIGSLKKQTKCTECQKQFMLKIHERCELRDNGTVLLQCPCCSTKLRFTREIGKDDRPHYHTVPLIKSKDVLVKRKRKKAMESISYVIPCLKRYGNTVVTPSAMNAIKANDLLDEISLEIGKKIYVIPSAQSKDYILEVERNG